MELVVLAHVTLNRIGSASRHGMAARAEAKVIREVPDESTTSLQSLVTSIAVEYGEQREALRELRHSVGWSRVGNCESHVFDVHGSNVQYSTVYAECWIFPALKAGERYFRLDEVKLTAT